MGGGGNSCSLSLFSPAASVRLCVCASSISGPVTRSACTLDSLLMSMREKLDLLQQKRAESALGGGADRIAAQHEKGKLTARERLDAPPDPGTVLGLDPLVTHRATDFGLAGEKDLG